MYIFTHTYTYIYMMSIQSRCWLGTTFGDNSIDESMKKMRAGQTTQVIDRKKGTQETRGRQGRTWGKKKTEIQDKTKRENLRILSDLSP